MIREGVISRDEALKRLNTENRIYIDDLKKLLATADMDSDTILMALDVDQIVKDIAMGKYA